MSSENHQQTSLKQKVAHEAREFLAIFLFLAMFFMAFAEYRSLLLREFEIPYFGFGTALINALVMAKIIMIGEYAGLGKRHEERALIVSTFYKAFVFGLLAAAFHILEEAVKALVHHKRLAQAFDVVLTTSGRYELLGHALVLFCAFIPFFAFTETGRALGGDQLHNLFFRRDRITADDKDVHVSDVL